MPEPAWSFDRGQRHLLARCNEPRGCAFSTVGSCSSLTTLSGRVLETDRSGVDGGVDARRVIEEAHPCWLLAFAARAWRPTHSQRGFGGANEIAETAVGAPRRSVTAAVR